MIPMKKSYFLLPLLFLFYSCNIKEQSEIQKEVIAAEEVIEIDADDLVKSFVKDSTAAAELYVGKVLSVKGKVAIFEQIDTVALNTTDSMPGIVKWIVKRLESDINTSNIFFDISKVKEGTPPYSLMATFPREYRKELIGVKEKDKVNVKGKLEHINTVSQVHADSSKTTITYTLSLQGCLIEPKK